MGDSMEQAVKLDNTVEEIESDALSKTVAEVKKIANKQPSEYLKGSVVPEGGE